MPRYPKSFGSYNFGVRKNVFDEVGGFDSSYRKASGEDNDLSYKVQKKGYKIFIIRIEVTKDLSRERVMKKSGGSNTHYDNNIKR